MAVLTGDGHHALRAEGVAVHDQCFDHLGHRLALRTIQQRLLLRCQLHKTTSFIQNGVLLPLLYQCGDGKST